MINTTQFGLRYAAVRLSPDRRKSPAHLIEDLNKYVVIPSFTTTVPSWPGSSYVAAQLAIDFGTRFSFETPIRPVTFNTVPAVAWLDEYNTWHRRKLWLGYGEKLSYPLYRGEILPAAGVQLEFWTVRHELTVSLAQDWWLPISELELPSEFDDTTAAGTTLGALCLTHADEIPDSLEQALGICNFHE